MGETGDLAKRLRSRMERESAEVEAWTREELQKLALNLHEHVYNARCTIENDIASHTEAVNRVLEASREQTRGMLKREGLSWLKWAFLGLSLCAGIFGGSWGTMRYFSSEIQEQMANLERLKAERAEMEASMDEWGLKFIEDENGRFVVLPNGWIGKTGWTVGKNQAIKLERK